MKKQNKRTQITRIALALLLILSMIGNTLILPATAQETLTPTDEALLPETPLDGTGDATGVPTLSEPIQLTAADIPEFISAAALEERGAVERMRAEETNMSSVIFRNADGTRTMYMYGLPVKYTALDGTVRDKSTNLVSVSTVSALLADQPVAQTMAQMSTAQQAALQAELGILDAERAATTLHMLSTALTNRGKSLSDMAYTTLDNDVYALFPTNLTEGMTLVFSEHSVRMTPAMGMTMTTGGNVTKTTTASLADSDVTERLLYPNVFGPGTAVQYTPTLTGVKEEILLAYNVGKNSFDFLVETGGLLLTEQNGQFVLIDPETEQQVGTLGEIIVFDSAGQIVRGNMTAQTVKEGEIYGVTISVDQEFLASATYPVSIDPSISIQYAKDTSVIEDIGIYNDANAWNYTFEDFPYVGKTVMGDYVGALAIRFPFIFNDDNLPFEDSDDTTIQNDALTSAAQIGYASLIVKVQNSSQYPVTLGAKACAVSWSENGMRICDEDVFGTAMSGPNTFSWVKTFSSAQEWSLNVTEIMRAWYNYENGITQGTSVDPEKGLLLYSNTPTIKTPIGSIKSSNPAFRPYLRIDYITEEQVGPYYINNKESHQFLLCTDLYTTSLQAGRVEDLGTNMEWMLYYMGGEKFALTPADYEGISFINMGGTLSIAESSPEPYCQWTMITDWTDFAFRNGAEDEYFLAYVYDVQASQTQHRVGYEKINGSVNGITDPAITDYSKWRLILKADYNEFPEFTTNSIAVYLDGDQSAYDVLGIRECGLITSNDLTITINGVPATVQNGEPMISGTPGTFVNIRIKHEPTEVNTVVVLYIGAIDNGVYMIRNKQSNYFIANSGRQSYSSGIVLESAVKQYGMFFEFALLDDGYYTIKFFDTRSHNYYIVSENSSIGPEPFYIIENVLVTGYLPDKAKWRITTASEGAFKISPKIAEDSAFYMEITPSGTYSLTMTTYTDDDDLLDEWYFVSVPANWVELEGQEKENWCWAASARMFAKYYYSPITYTQADAVDHVKGSPADVTGTMEDAAEAIRHYASTADSDEIPLNIYDGYIYSEHTLQSILSNNVVYIVQGEYANTSINSYISSHAMLIVGCFCDGDTYWYIVQDPSPVGEGRIQLYTYSQLYHQYTHGHHYVWTSTMVLTCPDSNYTELCYFYRPH